jgi:hypothetical protein
MRQRLLGLCWVGATLSCCVTVYAGEPEPVVRGEFRQQPRDLALILDTSGSMVKRDPSRLAIYAAKVFTDLAEAQDRVFVVPFPPRDERADDGRIIGEKDTGWFFENWAKSRAAIGPLGRGFRRPRVLGGVSSKSLRDSE